MNEIGIYVGILVGSKRCCRGHMSKLRDHGITLAILK